MSRGRNTDVNGIPFHRSIVDAVWAKGKVVHPYDGSLYRQDSCGAWMKKTEHGKTTEFGWEIDHIYPVARGGTDNLSNLQPLEWKNNRQKSDDLNWTCAVGSK